MLTNITWGNAAKRRPDRIASTNDRIWRCVCVCMWQP